jgi:hypothetical protein
MADVQNLRLELTETLGHYVERARRPLWARCASLPCRHSKRLEPLRLANRYGWTATLESIRKRLRCIRCGCRDCELVDFDPKSPPPPYPDFKVEPTPADAPRPRRARRHP